jgi:hypothetical protein
MTAPPTPKIAPIASQYFSSCQYTADHAATPFSASARNPR